MNSELIHRSNNNNSNNAQQQQQNQDQHDSSRSTATITRFSFRDQRLIFLLIGVAIATLFFNTFPLSQQQRWPDPIIDSGSVNADIPTRRVLYQTSTKGDGFETAMKLGGKVPLGLKAKRLRIVVTGGAGFVGSHLVDRLIARGDSVIVVDNFFTGRKENLVHQFGNPRFELIRHDVVEPILLEVDQIYHLACPASPVHYKFNPTNVVGTLNMLGLAKRVGARFLLTSTSEVYGDPLQHPQVETYWGNVNPIGVRSCYDEGKRTAETLSMDYHRGLGIEVRIARIFNTYGPRMCIDDGRVVSNFVAQALRKEPLTVYGDGKQTRSFQYVSDLVEGLMRLMEGEHVGPFNLGNPGEFTMLELAQVVQEVIDPNAKIEFKANTEDDPHKRRPDISKAKELLGWEPVVSLRKGLPLMVSDFRQQAICGIFLFSTLIPKTTEKPLSAYHLSSSSSAAPAPDASPKNFIQGLSTANNRFSNFVSGHISHQQLLEAEENHFRTGTMSRKGLMEQDLGKLDVTKLHPLSPEVISRQATINIGTIGHVAHGKSTVVKAISGVQTVRFKNELERNITIKLGYANAKIYKCEDERCPRPMAYGSGKEDSPLCDVPGFENARMKLLRHVSFVDCPGHDILMATMLNGAAIMDGALLLIAANESCPQPQTSEHLAAVEIMRLQHIIILQNKVDLIQENVAINQNEAIKKFIEGTVADGAPVVPISAQLKYNIDVVCEYIVKKIPIPERNFISPPNMIVIRSFDVNKPGFEVDDIKGGVAGGSILRGVLKVNQFIEVRPGIVVKDENGNTKCTPIYSRIVSLYAEQNELQYAVPGGLIGVGTTMDPTLTRADRLVGQVLGEVGSLPEVFVELEVNFFLLRRLLGVKTKGSEKQGRVTKLTKGEMLMLNIGSMSTGARVLAVKNDLAKLQLTSPVCTSKGEKIALSRRVEKHWRLIGWGQIQAGTTLDVPPCPI
ncbi:hypothetical protein F8388_013079 [Cannabis sativa]|uniref:Tr-type G domain-containing protein n=1 Tax=Cannabis sativa TaxID=3483 RepID=A0A7J6EBF8_CANSA|nr:hypothetical protein F8388_013079 [Cannabis sativa]